MSQVHVTFPCSEQVIRALKVGDEALLSGVIVTSRDTGHKHIVENLIRASSVEEEDSSLHEILNRHLRGGAIYHCGPITHRSSDGRWVVVAAGPTTSSRLEAYTPEVIAHFGLRGIIGKGGMGDGTLSACREHGAAYFHTIGGAASLIASSVVEVLGVEKLREFGSPEAYWILQVAGLPSVVTVDSHGRSLHDELHATSGRSLRDLLPAKDP
jgi:fumarate hydratase subunit beta